MNPEIEQIYDERAQQRAKSDFRYDMLVRTVISLSAEYGLRIRDDAVYFLANNMIDMVADPLATARDRKVAPEGTFQAFEGEFENAYVNDLGRIIHSAAEVAQERERQELSSTTVVIALGRVIDELNINDMKIWGRAAEERKAVKD